MLEGHCLRPLIEFLRSLNLQWNKIAEVLGISRHTLYQRLREEGILDVSDDDLDDIIPQVKLEHPNDGEVLIDGHLEFHAHDYMLPFIDWILLVLLSVGGGV